MSTVPQSPRIAGRYRLLERVGTGGMGVLWGARDERSGLPVAVRVLTRGVEDAARVAHFRASARAAARLEHPHVARVLDEGQDEAGPFIVAEWIDGEPLSSWIGLPLPWGFVRAVLLQIVDGLCHVHARGLVHLDLRPKNVLVCRGAAGPIVRLVDVGCARVDDGWSDRPTDARQTLKLLGSLRYMPPEAVDSPPWRTGPWSDLYTVGLVLWELLVGELPQTADSAIALLMKRATTPAPALPDGVGGPHHATLRTLLERLLARRPEDRPRTAAQVCRTLESLDEPTAWVEPVSKRRFRQSGFDAGQARAAGFPLLPLEPGPLVGRDDALGTLRGALHDVVSGYGSRLVVLEGPVGVGKTRLAEALRAEAEEDGQAHTWRATFTPGSPPGSGLAGALEELLRAGDTDAAGVRARAAALPLLLGIEPEGLDEVLSAVLRPAAGDDGEPAPTEQTAEDPRPWPFVTHAFVEVLRRAARNEAVVLVLEDLHWAPEPEGAPFVRRLLREAGLGVLVVATVATDQPGSRALHAALAGEPRAAWLTLEPLDEDAVRTYVRRRLGVRPADEDRLVDAVGAHPVMLRGLVDLLLAAGLVPGPDGLALPAGTLLPDDLRELFGRSAERLPAQGADTLVPDVVQGLAHARLPLDPRVLAALEATDPDRPWHRALAAAERERLMVRSPLGRWRFVHRMVADWLALQGRDRAPAWHRTWLQALARLETGDRGRLGVERAHHHECLGERREAVSALLEAAAREAAPGQPAGERGLLAAERAVALADDLRDARLVARSLRARAALLRRAGRPRAAAEALDGAESWLATGEPEPDAGEQARCRLLRAWLAVDAGDAAAALEQVERARQAFDRAGDRVGWLWTSVAMGTAARLGGQQRLARTIGRQAEEGFVALGARPGQLAARRLRAAAADDAGDHAAAERRYARLQDAADEHRWLPDRVLIRLHRARLALETQRAHDALALLDQAGPIAEAAGLEDARAFVEAVRPAALAAAGRHAEGRAALRRAPTPGPALAPAAAAAVAAGARHPTTAIDPALRDALLAWAGRLRAPPVN
jgi:hypothetical protein